MVFHSSAFRLKKLSNYHLDENEQTPGYASSSFKSFMKKNFQTSAVSRGSKPRSANSFIPSYFSGSHILNKNIRSLEFQRRKILSKVIWVFFSSAFLFEKTEQLSVRI